MSTKTTTHLSTWIIDPTQSTIEFTIKRFLISMVKGRFRKFEGAMQFDGEDPLISSLSARIDVASIDTGDPNRDARLLSKDFLNADKFSLITYESTRVERIDEHIEHQRVWGDLTIHDITKELSLGFELVRRVIDIRGSERISFAAEGEIGRKEFGLRDAVRIRSLVVTARG